MDRTLIELVDKINRQGREIDALKRIEMATITDPAMALPMTMATIQSFPALRGFWPGSAHLMSSSVGYANDLSAAGRHLRMSGAPTFNYRGAPSYAPYMNFSSEYLYYVDDEQFDILGNESWIGDPGLTLGGWFYFDSLTGQYGLMGKYFQSGNNRSYLLYTDGSPYEISFLISGDGLAERYASATSGPSTGQWYFVVGQYKPSTEMAVWVGDSDGLVEHINLTSIPASLYNSTARLEVGAFNNGGFNINGSASMLFICASHLPDLLIQRLFNISRHAFGV